MTLHTYETATPTLSVPSLKLVSAQRWHQGAGENIEMWWTEGLRLKRDIPTAEELIRRYHQSGFKEFYAALSGQFGLVVLDKGSNKLWVVNDHLGIQPLFYTHQNGSLYLADSLKNLTAQADIQSTISKQAIYHYFYFHCIPSPQTIYTECHKLEPAVALQWSSEPEVERLNCYCPQFAQSIASVNDAQQTCLNIVEQAVTQQASAGAGAFLSGGLDSSTVAGMLAKVHKPAKTFSIGFKTKAYDETEYALITAKHFKTQHEVFYLEPEEAADEFVKVAQYFDEPFGNSSAMAAYFCARFAKSHGVEHLLAGDGGDELFAGNMRYAKQKKFELFHRLPGPIQTAPRALFCNPLASKLPGVKKLSSYIRQADIPLPERLETYNFVHQLGADDIFDAEFLAAVDTKMPEQMQQARYNECQSHDPVDKMLYLDWKYTLADNDLVKVSKMCELAGVKVSYPLLDKALVDFSCTVPAEVKLPGYELRDFYKKTCKNFLADETLTKSKHGFGLPFGVWMKENEKLQHLTLQCLERFKERGIVKQELIANALKSHQTVHAGYYGELIWIIVVLELWLQGQEREH